MVKKLAIFFIVLTFCQCMMWEPLRFEKQENRSNKLKLDGYYYTRFLNSNANQVIFLYSNGVIYQVIDNSDYLSVIENSIKSNAYAREDKGNPIEWGAYIIKGDSIYIDRWIVGGGTGDKPREYGVGIILNDTTFTNSGFSGSGLFRFRHFSIKPDSTNRFVK